MDLDIVSRKSSEDSPVSIFGLGGFKWLNLAQFGGALNDNFLKLAIIYALGVWWVGRDEKEILGLVGVAFAIPFLLLLGLGGNLADRLSKSKIVQWAKFFEIVIAICAFFAFYWQSVWGLFSVAFLMAGQSAIFSPSKYGIIPELVGRQNIAKANGYLQAFTYLAIIAGTLLAPTISGLLGGDYALMTVVAIAIALAGWVFSLGIPQTPKGDNETPPSPLVMTGLIKTIKHIHQDGFLTLAVWSSAYFSFVAGFAQLNLLSYGTEHLLMGDSEEATSLFLFIALGIGAGSVLAGLVSKKGIEFGIVPIGAFLLAASTLALGFIDEGQLTTASLICGLMGVGAGLFIVPVDSFIQYRTEVSRRGEVIAATAWLSWVGILLSALAVYALPKVGMTASEGFIVIGVMLVALFVCAMHQLPDFFVRFLVMILARFYYRLKIEGQENIPANGPAIIAVNHSSLCDAAFLIASQSRRIRFLMEREYLSSSNLFMKAVFNLMGVIPISKKATPKEIVRALKSAKKALEEGWLVGIFPEGTLSRTGHLLDFKRGVQRLAMAAGAPIVPGYIDGAYGSSASYANGVPVPLSRRDFRRPISLVFGKTVSWECDPQCLRKRVSEISSEASGLRSSMMGSVGRQVIKSARRNWKKIAVRDSSGKCLTFGEFVTSAIAFSSKLNQLVDREQKIIGVMLPPSVAASVVNVSLALLRKPSANLNYTSSPEAISSAIETASIKTILTSRTFLKKAAVALPAEKCVFVEDIAGDIGILDKIGAYLMAKFLPVRILLDDEGWCSDELLTVLFSSGSTAIPKGVMLSHANITSNIEAFSSVARVRSTDCVLGVLPFFHSMGYTTTLWFPLLKGISACYHYHPLECEQIQRLCAISDVSVVIGTPTFMLAWARRIDPAALRKLRWACAGAEKMRTKIADLFEKQFGVRPMEGYGTTECSPVVTVNVPDVEVDGVFQRGIKEGAAGRPLPNLQCRTTDQNTGEELSDSSGVLWIKGPSVMLGYLGDPEKTAQVLNDGWYNTGDIAKIDTEGFVTITDRLSRFSKIGGEMISHTAVEEGIKKYSSKFINQKIIGLVVTSLPDEKKGERLVVLYESEVGSIEEIMVAVANSPMPNLWKPSPRNWLCVEKIPVLGTGKLDLGSLKKLASNLP